MDVSLNANVITMQTVLPQKLTIAEWKKVVKFDDNKGCQTIGSTCSKVTMALSNLEQIMICATFGHKKLTMI